MSSEIVRRFPALQAALALVLAQLIAVHAGVFAGAIGLALGLAAHGHGHGLSLLVDAGHVDVVLHHDERAEGSGAPAPGLGAHDGDHVVHVAISETVREGKLRVAAPPTALPARGSIASSAQASAGVPAAPAATARSTGLLRTVVLRI